MSKLTLASMALIVLGSFQASANALVYSPEYYQIKEIEVTSIDKNGMKNRVSNSRLETGGEPILGENVGAVPGPDGKVTLDTLGKIISVGKDLVALGEDLYKLIVKGRPSVKTDYAPISVVSKDASGNYIDVMDMEDWSMPKSEKYMLKAINGFGMEVIRMEYMIIFTYGGTYMNSGAYITGLQIIPTKVKALFGYDLTATYKLQSIANHGKRDNPVAGAVISLQYTINNILSASEHNDTFHITGLGKITDYIR